MKLIKISILTALFALPFMFAGCGQDLLESAADGAHRSVSLTVTAAKDAPMRTTLAENADGDLDCRWQKGDYLIVARPDGTKIGELGLQPDADNAAVATFRGTIEYGGEEKLNFIYPGTNTTAGEKSSSVTLAEQSGIVAGLTSQDVLTATAQVSAFEGGVKADLGVMHRKLAFGRFRLSFPQGVDAAEAAEITVGGAGVMTSATLSWGGAMPFEAADGAGVVSVSVADASADFYLSVIPQAGIEPTFSVTLSDGSTYTGTLPSRDWKAGEYVRASSADGSFTAVEVPVVEGSYEDPRNPLTKWAKSNLVRVDGLTNDLAESSDAPGALFQWGRNYGYMPTAGFYAGTQFEPSSLQYTQFLDAFGTYETPAASGQRIFDYYVYNPNNLILTNGVGMHPFQQPSGMYEVYEDMPKEYSSLADLKANPTKYFMDGRPQGKIGGIGSYAAGMDVNDNNPDYWIDNFGNGGSTWAERASACGYASSDPCPEGWRLPTLAEFREIAPEGAGVDVTGTLADALNNKAELRQTAAGVRYVIRWIYSSDAITVESVVVDNDFRQSDINALFWDMNSKKKVVRKFPFTGSITPLIGNASGALLQTDTWVVRPFHRGTVKADCGMFPLTVGPYTVNYWVVGPEDTVNANSSFGGYWVSEKGYAFKFVAKDKMPTSKYSCLLVESAEPVSGYAIRPVMK